MAIVSKTTYISILLAFFLFVGCTKGEEQLFVIEKEELYGFVNQNGDTIIDCIYPMVYTDTIKQIGFVADTEGRILCFNNNGDFLFNVYKYDNGPDYPCEGLFRIIDKTNLIGFADTLGHIVISPQYKFAYPFVNGKAKVTNVGSLCVDSTSVDMHHYWQSDKWYFISHNNQHSRKKSE